VTSHDCDEKLVPLGNFLRLPLIRALYRKVEFSQVMIMKLSDYRCFFLSPEIRFALENITTGVKDRLNHLFKINRKISVFQ